MSHHQLLGFNFTPQLDRVSTVLTGPETDGFGDRVTSFFLTLRRIGNAK